MNEGPIATIERQIKPNLIATAAPLLGTYKACFGAMAVSAVAKFDRILLE